MSLAGVPRKLLVLVLFLLSTLGLCLQSALAADEAASTVVSPADS